MKTEVAESMVNPAIQKRLNMNFRVKSSREIASPSGKARGSHSLTAEELGGRFDGVGVFRSEKNGCTGHSRRNAANRNAVFFLRHMTHSLVATPLGLTMSRHFPHNCA
jgi:hypothetical protein